jgi:phosphoribosylanthranilate isomerase
MTRIKICGIRTVEHALAAAEAGADAIGFVFHAASPRNVEPALVRDIVRTLPAFVTTVGLFVNRPAAEVRAIRESAELDLVQLSGDETAEYCAELGVPYIKALRVGSQVGGVGGLLATAKTYSATRGILLDAHVPGEYGGTGVALDWHALAGVQLGAPLVLAGGLTPSNVGEAISVVKPWAVDVSSGVESSRGQKDSELIRQFVSAVKAVN